MVLPKPVAASAAVLAALAIAAPAAGASTAMTAPAARAAYVGVGGPFAPGSLPSAAGVHPGVCAWLALQIGAAALAGNRPLAHHLLSVAAAYGCGF